MYVYVYVYVDVYMYIYIYMYTCALGSRVHSLNLSWFYSDMGLPSLGKNKTKQTDKLVDHRRGRWMALGFCHVSDASFCRNAPAEKLGLGAELASGVIGCVGWCDSLCMVVHSHIVAPERLLLLKLVLGINATVPQLP